MGKARMGTEISRSTTVRPALGTGADRARTHSGIVAKNMATESPASDQASQELARRLIPPTSSSLLLASVVTTPL
jgi:hypothetical protein